MKTRELDQSRFAKLNTRTPREPARANTKRMKVKLQEPGHRLEIDGPHFDQLIVSDHYG